METTGNKPRVFLSHSSLDKPFINRVCNDLRSCYIDPWVDSAEIRDGKPWMNVIFQHGIPACDAIIAYFTENSLKSKVVEKEIDVGLISQINDSSIAFLPYVSADNVREVLRPDIKALHCRKWNDDNYHEVFPRIVAEIWHSYLERVVNTAILTEKNKRLELELEIGKLRELQKESLFSQQEEADFTFIKNELEKMSGVTVSVSRKKANSDNKAFYHSAGEDGFGIRLIDIVNTLVINGETDINDDLERVGTFVLSLINEKDYPKQIDGYSTKYIRAKVQANLLTRLLTYGFLKTARHVDTGAGFYTYYDFSEKLFRFMYWQKHKEFDLYKAKLKYYGNTPIE